MKHNCNCDALFTPFKVGGMEVKNRVIMAPMGTYAANMDGSMSEAICRCFDNKRIIPNLMSLTGEFTATVPRPYPSFQAVLEEPHIQASVTVPLFPHPL